MTKFTSPLIVALSLAAGVFAHAQTPAPMRPRDVEALPSKAPDTRIPYGTDDQQFGELRLPKSNGPFPVAIVIHGGCWVAKVATTQSTAAIADALRDAGIATWNIEYRRLDSPGGGWPGTFTDIGAAVDFVRVIAEEHPLDLSRVATVGHSSGGHLALWAAARSRLPKDSALYTASPLALRAAVALGGPGDLRAMREYDDKICGAPVVDQLMGGAPDSVPDRYAQGSPAEMLPLGVRQVLIVGLKDPVMPPPEREMYAAKATKAGDRAEIVEVPGGHFEAIAPTSAAWPIVRDTRDIERRDTRQVAWRCGPRGASGPRFDRSNRLHPACAHGRLTPDRGWSFLVERRNDQEHFRCRGVGIGRCRRQGGDRLPGG